VAITVTQALNGTGTNATITLTVPPNTGQPIVVLAGGWASNVQIGATDNASNGAYSVLGFNWDTTNSRALQALWIKSSASSGSNLVITLSGSVFATYLALVLNGFAGTATADTSLTANWNSPSGTTGTFSPIASTQNNEILLMTTATGSFQTAQPSGWSEPSTSHTDYYAICATSGTSKIFAFTINATSWFDGLLTGIYDAVTTSSGSLTFNAPGVISGLPALPLRS